MRVLFALSGLHRHDRGAETALMSIASELTRMNVQVTLIGSGHARLDQPYRFIHAGSLPRERFERFPSLPVLRDVCIYEELTFAPWLLRRYRPGDFDVTLTCSFPFTNWVLRRPTVRGRRPPHVYVTQNGDWPAVATTSEFRFFGCEGLVCTNPDFLERTRSRWRCRLIPNGIDRSRFQIGVQQRKRFGLPVERPIVLMVSALVASKRVLDGIESVSRMRDAHLIVAGDGPLRNAIDAKAAQLMPGRFTRLTLPSGEMPALYQSTDVFLHLAAGESFGNVYLEAQACGVPVVAHDSPRLRWILGDSEYLTDTQDPELVGRAIAAALKEPQSRRQVRADRADAFSLPRIAEQYRSFLEEVIELTKRTSYFSAQK